METFKERLLKEHDELHIKINKLKMFTQDESFTKIDMVQQRLLFVQLDVMNAYDSVLTTRINLLM